MSDEPVTQYPLDCRVAALHEIARDTFRLALDVPQFFFDTFAPGRFANVKVPGAKQMLLRRPFSIYEVDPAASTAAILFKVIGAGTKILSQVKPGEYLNVLMPLGKGFQVDDRVRTIWTVGGGAGLGALGSVASAYPQVNTIGFFGFRSAKDVPKEEFLPRGLCETYLATEDGSTGAQGLVTDLVAQALEDGAPDLILACGPSRMYAVLKQVVGTRLPVQISVEERMGCGTGGCETCVCAVKGHYLKSCTDGPVFLLSEVDEYAG